MIDLFQKKVSNKKMRIAICDDEIIYRIAIFQAIERWQKVNSINGLLIKQYHSSEELLFDIENGQSYDVLFLDIQIPNEMGGIDLAKRIRELDECTQIVFFTNYSEYACEGYHVNALRYLHKPVHPEQVSECMNIAYRQWTSTQGKCFILENKSEKIVLRYKSVLYIESSGHSIIIHHIQKDNTINIRYKLSQILEKLPETIFVMCNRSYIVNIIYVRKIAYDKVIMSDGEEIAIGKRYRETLRVAFGKYFQGV